MTRWRLATALVLLLGIGSPLAAPFLELLAGGKGWQAWTEGGRLLFLAANTLRLGLGTVALSVPAGIGAAVLLYRTDLPLRKLFRFVMLLSLFVPLPVCASAWQAALSGGSGLPFGPGAGPWVPWMQGFGAATGIYAVAALPWVILIVGQGLSWVETDLEEDALLATGPLQVLRHVTLPRCQAALWAAALWVFLQTATDAGVAFTFQIPSFAEEVYSQFVLRDESALARSVAVSIPAVVLTGLLVLAVARHFEKNLPPLKSPARAPLLFRLGRLRWPAFILVLLWTVLLAGLPLAALVWRAGLGGNPETFSAHVAWHYLASTYHAKGRLIVENCLGAGLAGIIAAGLALVSVWLAVESRRFLLGLLCLMALAWALPAPVAGIGLKETIHWLMNGEEAVATALGCPTFRFLGDILYYKASPLPALWAAVIRFFPCALVLLWPIARLFPPEMRDHARVDGARPIQEFKFVFWPMLAPVATRAALAVAILALGEIGASKLVTTPGSETFVLELFNQMHYGVKNNLSALCLVLLTMVGLGGGFLAVIRRLFPGRWQEN